MLEVESMERHAGAAGEILGPTFLLGSVLATAHCCRLPPSSFPPSLSTTRPMAQLIVMQTDAENQEVYVLPLSTLVKVWFSLANYKIESLKLFTCVIDS